MTLGHGVWPAARRFFARQWFLCLLVLVLAVGGGWSSELAGPLERLHRGWLVAVVMFVTALPLRLQQFSTAARAWKSLGIAISLTSLVAPLLAWLVGRALPEELAIGLVVAGTVPCTLASAAVWTRLGGGNDALALVVTFITNLSCFAVMPLWLALLAGRAEQLDSFAILAGQLAQRVALPVLLAQCVRVVPALANTVDRFRKPLGIAAQSGVLVMLLMGAVTAGVRLSAIDAAPVPAWWLLAMAAGCATVHLTLFAVGWTAARGSGEPPSDALAVAVSGSQKTLMIGLDVALGYGGLAVLPMVTYHVLQLLIDTPLVTRLARQIHEDDRR